MSKSVTYRKGPLGYAVLVNGKPVGRISDRRIIGCGWQVNVPGLNSTEVMKRGLFRGETLFASIVEAKTAIEKALTNIGKLES